MSPIKPVDWATLDRKTVFRCFFRSPGTTHGLGVYSDSKQPIYVEAKSLAKLVEFTTTMAQAVEADLAFASVEADRYSLSSPPDMLPPRGFMSVNDALAGC